MELWEALDTGKVDLPLFVAADQKRIPPVTASDSDASVMSVDLMEVKVQLKHLAKSQQQLADSVAGTGMQRKLLESTKSAISEAIISTQEFPPLVDAANRPPTAQGNSASWSKMADEVAASGGIRGEVCKTNTPASRDRKKLILRGKRPAPDEGVNVKAIPRRIYAFVGRLDIETTEESLKTFLLDAGFHYPYCIGSLLTRTKNLRLQLLWYPAIVRAVTSFTMKRHGQWDVKYATGSSTTGGTSLNLPYHDADNCFVQPSWLAQWNCHVA